MTTKCAYTLLLLLGISFTARAQNNMYNQVLQDSLVKYYNTNNFQQWYNLGSDEWKNTHSLNDITGWLSWMHSQTGNLQSASLINDTGKFQLIRWDGDVKTTAFMFQPLSATMFNDFYFGAFKAPLSAAELKEVHSDNPLKTSLDSAINIVASKFMIYNKPPALSVGVVVNGFMHVYNYGSLKKGEHILPTVNTYYEIGSIIKTFTSRLLAKAVIDKMVSLDDDVRKYLHGNYANLQYQNHPIRLKDLASYASALPAYQILRPFDESTPQTAAAFFKTYAIDSFLTDISRVKLDTIPGTRYTYSTAGFNLLAYVLSNIYHKPFPELIQQYIAKPLSMKRTKSFLSVTDKKDFPVGFNAQGVLQADITGPIDTLDVLYSTVHDMLLYLKNNMDTTDPVIALSHKQFSDAPNNEAGLGWFLYKTPLGNAIGKGGNSVHMSCRAWAIPEKKAGMVCFTNNNQIDWGDFVDDIMKVIVKN
jgi:CubicO group peptidase (beta-lactamase class C family)